MLNHRLGGGVTAWYGGTVTLVGTVCLLMSGARLSTSEESWLLALIALAMGTTMVTLAAPGDPAAGLYAGVIARRLRHPALVWAARVLVVVTAPVAGVGVVAYATASLADALTNPEPAPALDWRRVTGTGMLGLAVLLGAIAAGLTLGTLVYLWSLALIGSGIAQFWSAAGVRGQVSGSAFGEHTLLRSLLGALLVAGGAVLILNRALHLRDGSHIAVATLAALAAITFVVGPWWLRGRGMLERERISRARATERAELADQLHDSVLQTLALIQRRADDSEAVAMLARKQERDLRDWLLGRRSGQGAHTLDEALRALVADVEDTFAARFELVTVGDTPLEASNEAILSATREALVNACRHAHGAHVSVFMRADPQRIQIYVHDRGPGFDTSTIDEDRHGISDSIVARMRRNGGTAEIRSAPGAGCEVILTLERQ